MFTGLVQAVGRIVSVRPSRGAKRLEIASDLPSDGMAEGESIAVDGVCLTAYDCRSGRFRADVVAETLALTTLGSARVGRQVNLERSLRLGDRLGGHMVQGHVDGVVGVIESRRQGDDYRLRLELPDALACYLAHKGSVALNGVSLTVALLGAGWFEVALVPQTRQRTTLGELKVGERANMEIDVVARYLERLVSGRPDSGRDASPGKREAPGRGAPGADWE